MSQPNNFPPNDQSLNAFANGGLVRGKQQTTSGGVRGFTDGADGYTGAFADGGQVGGLQPQQAQMPAAMGSMRPPQGVGLQPQAGQPANPQMAQMNIQDMLQRNPQVAQQIKAHIDQAIQSGQLNPQMAQQVVQLAQACLQNPSLWPQIRQYAIKAGLCGPNDLPQQYDQGLVITILTAAKAYTQGNNPGAYANGGMIHGPGTGTSDSIPGVNTSTGAPVKVSNGEMIIPADVVRAKGADFFQNLINKYHGSIPRGEPQSHDKS